MGQVWSFHAMWVLVICRAPTMYDKAAVLPILIPMRVSVFEAAKIALYKASAIEKASAKL